MKNLMLAEGGDFFQTYGMMIILLAVVLLLVLFSFFRRKREMQYRQDLNSKIVPGAKIKTYNGLYATVVSVRETTDGKLLVVKTGDEEHFSYQQIHINAVYALDESEDVKVDENGEVIYEDLDKQISAVNEQFEAQAETEEKKPAKRGRPKKSDVGSATEQPKSEDNTSKPQSAKKPATAKKSTSKKTTKSSSKK